MKKAIIGGLVGGFILWMWQFLSWTMFGIHTSQTQYMEKQDSILACLHLHEIPEGEYMIPNMPQDASPEDQKEAWKGWIGKPWATVHYHHSLNDNMGMNMMRGFVIDFVAAFLLCWLLMGQRESDFKKTLLSSIVVGLIGYFTSEYLGNIWFERNTLPDLIDAVASWGLVGAFFGWYLNR